MTGRAILVIDMPESCDKCPCFFNAYTDMCCQAMNNRTISYPYPKDFRQDWCPLKPVPEKRDIDKKKCSDPFYEFEYEYGWNACIDEILRGEIHG